MSEHNIEIYTDGSCIGNPGPGGWGVLILSKEKTKLSGNNPDTTNNRMEMTAIIKALEWVHENHAQKNHTQENIHALKITIYSDSNLLIQTLTKGWKRKKNIDLWAQIDKLRAWLNINWVWVKAHDTNKYNNLVDKLAQSEAKKLV